MGSIIPYKNTFFFSLLKMAENTSSTIRAQGRSTPYIGDGHSTFNRESL